MWYLIFLSEHSPTSVGEAVLSRGLSRNMKMSKVELAITSITAPSLPSGYISFGKKGAAQKLKIGQ